MPRGKLKPASEVEYLSVLDADGTLDERLEPNFDDGLLARLHRTMLLSRRFDERMLNLHSQGRIGTFAPVSGQEAAQIGAVATLGDDDWMVPSYREIAAALWRGMPLEQILLYNAGYNEGGHIAEDKNDLPNAVPVGTQMLHAVGIAYAMKRQRRPGAAMTFFGDGATSQGDFHEALNFAGILEAPVVFVCENNQWAISVPRSKQTRSGTLAQKVLAYDIPGLQVDGNDVLAVYVAAREAVDRARNDNTPTLIECVTYRMQVHTTVDDPSKYRNADEVEAWRRRDPLSRLQRYMVGKDLLDDEKIGALEGEIEEEIGAAWKRARDAMERYGDPLQMFEHVYATRPAYLERQRAALAEEIGAKLGSERRKAGPEESADGTRREQVDD